MSPVRTRLLDYLERRGYLNTPAVRAAMDSVDRAAFVPERQKYAAWDDTPLPIGRGQTISAPHMVVMMLEELQPRPGQRLLEVGAGCGYHAAVAAAMV
ncbi:MAG: protein-L-isoaspartate O-methyltransferase, partial [Verrucomicrobia bacterium]